MWDGGSVRTVKRFDPVSVMKMSAICYAIFGVFEGAFVSIIFSIIPIAAPHDSKMPPFFGVIFGGLSIIFFPICFAIIGAIFGALGALIYNMAARWTGGIQMEVQ
jgi:hypothetical protein